MTATINASTTAGVVITPDNSGNVLLQYNGVSTPIFSAYTTTQTTMTNGAWTKIAYVTKMFDTNSNYDTTNSRYLPTVAGYYQILATNSSNSSFTASNTAFSIYKNGAEHIRGATTAPSSAQVYTEVTGIVYMNGTTDYVEIWMYQNSGSNQLNQSSGSLTQPVSVFQGCLLRGA